MTEAELEALALTTAATMRSLGKLVTYDGRIRPEDAAAMLIKKPGTLKNWRSDPDHPLKYERKTGTYRLLDVLRYIYSRQAGGESS